ncbi:MAG TPA: hypothetical protein VN726_22960 [Hanamia sp.]|nr:hypothetical protein [Hanamia sp.]
MAKILFSFVPNEKKLYEELPSENPLIIKQEDENGSFQADEDQRRFEQDEDRWHLDQEF